MVTSEELMSAGGVNRRTLTQLQQLRVIHQPMKRVAPSGRGLRAYWPDSALETMREVRRRRRAGQSIVDIAHELRRPVGWGDASDLARQRLAVLDRTFTIGAITHTGRQWIRGHLRSRFDGWSMKAEKATRIVETATTDQQLGWALSLMQYQTAPVLVVTRDADRVFVTPDFLVAHEISAVHQMERAVIEAEESTTSEGPTEDQWWDLVGASSGCIVVPLALLLATALRHCGGAPIEWPRYAPGRTMDYYEHDALVELNFRLLALPPGPGASYAFTQEALAGRVMSMLEPKVEPVPRKPRRAAAAHRKSDRRQGHRRKQP